MRPRSPSFLIVLVSVIVPVGPSPAQVVFTDGFETVALSPFWSVLVNGGSVNPSSGATVHCGSGALELTTPGPSSASVKSAMVRQQFSPAAYGRLSVWMFDTGAMASSSNYINLWCPPFSVGTLDYNNGPTNGGTYNITAGSASAGSGPTTVVRTAAWHLFVVDSTPSSSSITIDGQVVHAGVGGQPITEVQLEMHAPGWRPAWTAYFDDFSWAPYQGSTGPCGQVNSACASLLVNGVGASGCGPFAVTARSLCPIRLDWSGPPNQPYILFGSTGLVPGQVLLGNLIVDLNLPGLSLIYGGLDPLSVLFFSTDASGHATQLIQVLNPTILGTLKIQGVVFNQGSTCSSNPGFMTTASFSITIL